MLNRYQLLAVYWWWRNRQQSRKSKRRYYVRPAHMNQIQASFEIFNRYYQSNNPNDLIEFCRFSPSQFDELFELIEEHLPNHRRTHLRPITKRQRLVVFLRYLSEGISMKALAHEFRIGRSTTIGIVDEVCKVIQEYLGPQFLATPSNRQWLENAEGFTQIGFPRAIGAIDGKHFWIRKPKNTGSAFYNYKGYFSIVMLAVVDANSRFLLVDIGAAGRNSDSSLYLNSPIRRHLEGTESQIPRPQDLGQVGQVNYVILADGGFGLRDYMMTPFPNRTNNTPERIEYNTRLSSARRVVENAFGMLVHRFRLFLRMLDVNNKKAANLVHAAVILHNFMGPCEDFATEENLRQLAGLQLPNIAGNNRHARIIRDRFVTHLSQ